MTRLISCNESEEEAQEQDTSAESAADDEEYQEPKQAKDRESDGQGRYVRRPRKARAQMIDEDESSAESEIGESYDEAEESEDAIAPDEEF